MKEIICNFNLYDLHQKIYMIDKENSHIKELAVTTIENFPQDIIDACRREDVYDIHLYGSKDYAEGIKQSILTMANSGGLLFDKNKIMKIEVN